MVLDLYQLKTNVHKELILINDFILERNQKERNSITIKTYNYSYWKRTKYTRMFFIAFNFNSRTRVSNALQVM